jgi:hypothetical protein
MGTATNHCGTPLAPCDTASGKTVGAHRDMMQRSKIVFHSPPPPQWPDDAAMGKQTGKRLPEAEDDAMTGALAAQHIVKNIGREMKNGASDGARTRDLRRDRPAL